ncbi:hypothetical protein 23F_00058 [Ralstonia phage Gerry]|uniref:Uncharacterized protein n=1 Tax=Ralstonia phage Gerry TaxID=2759727 RepID=A0A7G5BA96_9CAUD|nr:hypothetical protein KMC47_gp64 [Ralstonia phage Gerry]QMV33219.1 hypothetical protein 23F_00058 [Ralstonia phage Gerry]
MAVIRNKGVVYAGKVGEKMRLRTPTPRFQCVGGQMDGHTLYLTTPSTVPMDVNGQRGRYVGCGIMALSWEAAA